MSGTDQPVLKFLMLFKAWIRDDPECTSVDRDEFIGILKSNPRFKNQWVVKGGIRECKLRLNAERLVGWEAVPATTGDQ